MDKLTSNSNSKVFVMKRFVQKMKSTDRTPLTVNLVDVGTGFLGGTIAIFLLLILTNMTATSWLMASFGASCVLVFAAWNAPLSQPRNIIGGHLITSVIGLVMLTVFGNGMGSIALAVGLSIACMMLTKTTHPPAGANPIIIILGGYSWAYLISPVFLGAIVIVVVALVVNNMREKRSYPTFWY